MYICSIVMCAELGRHEVQATHGKVWMCMSIKGSNNFRPSGLNGEQGVYIFYSTTQRQHQFTHECHSRVTHDRGAIHMQVLRSLLLCVVCSTWTEVIVTCEGPPLAGTCACKYPCEYKHIHCTACKAWSLH